MKKMQLKKSTFLICFALIQSLFAQAQLFHWGSEYSLGLTQGQPFRHNFTYNSNDVRLIEGAPILTVGVGFPLDMPVRQLSADSRLSLQLKPAVSFALPLQSIFAGLGNSVFMYELPLLLQFNKGVYGANESPLEKGWMAGAGLHVHAHHDIQIGNLPINWKVVDQGKSLILSPAFQCGYRYWSRQNRLTTLQLYVAPAWENYAGQSFNRSTVRLSLTTFYNY